MIFNSYQNVLIWFNLAILTVCHAILPQYAAPYSKLPSKGIGAPVAGACVANGKGCAEIGGSMLARGGSQVDAVIATALCEGVMIPNSVGIGGGFVGVIYQNSSQKIDTIVARESAPAAATEDMFGDSPTLPGALAVGVPGELLGYFELHRKYGVLPWHTLFQPAIKLAKEGHVVVKYLADAIAANEDHIRAEPTLAEIFVKSDGSIVKEGDFIRQYKLGETLEKIASCGISQFYGGGDIGRWFIEDLKVRGGIITEDDLRNYKVSWDDSKQVSANLTSGYTLYSTPLPTSGPLIIMANLIADCKLTSNSALFWQYAVEIFKFIYGQRTKFGDMKNDPERHDEIKAALEEALSPENAREICDKIFADRTFTDITYYGAVVGSAGESGTSNIACWTTEGDAVVMTTTINSQFGAMIRSHRTGIIYNDQMNDFSAPGVNNKYGFPPSPANFVKPGKRPQSSMSPTMVFNSKGELVLLVGAGGGAKIVTAILNVMFKYLRLNESLKDAVDEGRLHHQLIPMQVEAELDVPQSIIDYLREVGHKVVTDFGDAGFTAVTAIGKRDGLLVAQTDRRRVGSLAALVPINATRPYVNY